jgi:2-dehydropantoate 2-reductase
MRYIIYGAGAIGGPIGALLFEAGRDVVLIARGEHGRAVAANGLRLGTPAGGWRTLRIPIVEHPSALTIGAGDVVVLSMQSQGTIAALEALSHIARDVPIVCAQNGVENERVALRHFAKVHGVVVQLFGGYVEPGVVTSGDVPSPICDIGRYPTGIDDADRAIAADFSAASIQCVPRADIMAHKYAKLVLNTTNALAAAIGRSAPDADLARLAREESYAVFAAAGIPVATEPDPRVAARTHGLIEGRPNGGNSAYQSLERGRTRLETDYLNGEIVLLGRLHGVPTPVNEFLADLATRLVETHTKAGSLTLADVEAGRPVVSRSMKNEKSAGSPRLG